MSRIATACEACRRRKRRCDGRKPTCHLCETLGRVCEYPGARQIRRQKYWDRDYVRSLEDQVRLLSMQSLGPGEDSPTSESPESTAVSTHLAELAESTRSQKALTDFTSLNWPLYGSSNQRQLIFSGPAGYFNIPFRVLVPAFESGNAAQPMAERPRPLSAAEAVQKLSLDFKQLLKKLFLENINPYYNFVDPSWLAFSDQFPENDLVLQLLYSTVFAVSCFYSPEIPNDLHDGLWAYAEGIVLECCRRHLCLPVLQSLLMLSWCKHGCLDNSVAYMYHYMAIGLSTHMRVNEVQAPPEGDSSPPDIQAGLERHATLRTLWSLVFVDGYSTATLGAPPRLPWDVSQTPSYLMTMPQGSIEIPDVVFDHHLQLLRVQQEYINPIYQEDFPALSQSAKDALFLRGYTALTSLRKAVDPRLIVSRTTVPHQTQLVFWISYHTMEIILHRRFLDPGGASAKHAASLRAITAAAAGTVRLLKALNTRNEIHNMPPFVAYHIARAGLVHAVNITAEDERIRRTAKVQLQVCLNALEKMAATWPVFAPALLDFLRRVTESWGLEIGKEGESYRSFEGENDGDDDNDNDDDDDEEEDSS